MSITILLVIPTYTWEILGNNWCFLRHIKTQLSTKKTKKNIEISNK